MNVGDRVTHLDVLAQDGRTLPMKGTIVGVDVAYIVQWDEAESRIFDGGNRTYPYPPEVLVALDTEG